MSKETVSASKFSIINKILATFKIGDHGKLDSFIMRVEKKLNREITANEKNIETIKFNTKNQLDELNDELEDAQQELADSYLNVLPGNVETNEKATAYTEVYLDNINRKRELVGNIVDKIAILKVNSDDQIDEINLDIKFNKELIKNITAKENN